MMKAAILYTRVSTDEQAKGGHGLNAQTKQVEALANIHAEDRELLAIADDGQSGSSLNRPGLERALEMLASGQADMLIVSKLDRLSRSVGDFSSLSGLADAEGWTLVIGDPAVDTSKASGRLVLNIMMALGEWEREVIAERTKDGLAAARAKGVRLGRPVSVPEDVRQRIAEERVEGAKTYREIADGLMADGVPTGSGGATWHASSVRAVVISVQRDAEAVA